VTNQYEAKIFARDAALSETDECIIWPFSTCRDGYPFMGYRGTTIRISEIVLKKRVGPRPLGCVARHGPCRNTRCINPRHLSWGTIKQNNQDKLRDGTYGNKLTPDQVKMIRERLTDGLLTHQQIAKEFQVSRATIADIKTGRTWMVIQ